MTQIEAIDIEICKADATATACGSLANIRSMVTDTGEDVRHLTHVVALQKAHDLRKLKI